MLSPEATADVRALRAEASRAAATPTDASAEPGIIEIALGRDALTHRIAYAIHLQSGTAWHHLAISVKDFPDRLPSPLVISELMEAFDFVWKLRLPLQIPPVMTAGGYAMIGSARELPLVYRAAEAPAVVNIVESLLQAGRLRRIP